jgi:hypothetical protein
VVASVGRYGVRATAGANHVELVSVLDVDGIDAGAATDLVIVIRMTGQGSVGI